MENERIAQGLMIALEMEKRGGSLYKRAQGILQDEAMLSMLRTLENDEKAHLEIFLDMLRDYGVDTLNGMETELLLAQAASFFFPGGLMQASMEGALQSIVTVLEAAIEEERGAIAFYQRLYALATPSEQEVLEKIIKEEEGHLAILLERRASY